MTTTEYVQSPSCFSGLKKYVTKKERQLVFEKYDGRCAYCGCVLTPGWHIDHLKPKRRKKYKKDECRYPQRECIENYMPACASCNINKHAMKLEDFRQLVAGFMKHLNERNTQYKIAKRYGLVIEQEKPVIFYFERHMKEAEVEKAIQPQMMTY